MSKNVGNLLNDLAIKAGIPLTNPELVSLLQNAELVKIQVPDTLVSEIEKNLHTLTTAEPFLKEKLSPAIKAEAYDRMNDALSATFDELVTDPAARAELASEKMVTKKVVLALKKLSEVERKNTKSTDPEKYKIDLENAKNALKAQLEADFTTRMTAKEKEFAAQLTDRDFDAMFSNYRYAAKDGLTNDDLILIAKSKVKAKMQADKAKYTNKDGVLDLVKETGEDIFNSANGQKVNLKSYMEEVLSSSKLLQVSDPPKTGDNTGSFFNGSDNKQSQADAQYLSSLNEQMKLNGIPVPVN